MEMVHFIPPNQRRFALLAAQSDSTPVLLTGQSGTGKSALARWIHQNGPRASKVLVEATHATPPLGVAIGRPAISGQKRMPTPLATLLAAAQGGTLVVHEVGEWPLAEQKVLLQFVKTKSVSADVTTLLNVRVIATTSQGLEGRAQGGLFNPELFERLSALTVDMPALAQRPDEFEEIVLGLRDELGRGLHKEFVTQVSDEAWAKLRAYDWPGNLRELRNVLSVAMARASTQTLEARDLPDFGPTNETFRGSRAEFEKIYLLEVLKSAGDQVEVAAGLARMDRQAFEQQLKLHGIHPPHTP